jgi:hypothetical protein
MAWTYDIGKDTCDIASSCTVPCGRTNIIEADKGAQEGEELSSHLLDVVQDSEGPQGKLSSIRSLLNPQDLPTESITLGGGPSAIPTNDQPLGQTRLEGSRMGVPT